MKFFQIFSLLLLSLFFTGIQAHAVEYKTGESVSIGADQRITGSLFVSGSSVVVDGTIEGDLYCAGKSVRITGVVHGDVLCVGQSVSLEGEVEGDARLVGQMISVEGVIGKNVHMLGQSFSLENTGEIEGELLFAAQSAKVAGTVRGDLTYTSEQESVLTQTATVSGNTVYYKTHPKEQKAQREPKQKKTWSKHVYPSVLWYLTLGLVLVALFPTYLSRVQKHMMDSRLEAGLKGALFLFAMPVAMVMFFITILGIPVAILGIMLYAIAIAVSRIFVSAVVGHMLLANFAQKYKKNLYYQMLVGVPVVWIILSAPVIGGLLSFIAVLWGTGGMILGLRKLQK